MLKIMYILLWTTLSTMMIPALSFQVPSSSCGKKTVGFRSAPSQCKLAPVPCHRQKFYSVSNAPSHLFLGTGDDGEKESKPSNSIETVDDKEDESELSEEPQYAEPNIIEQIFDPIISSPVFSTFLFWTPFVANAKLRSRVSNFLSEYLDLSIAVPASIIGSIVAVIYVAYQNRLTDMEIAQFTTEAALARLREARSRQISYGSESGSSDENKKEYKLALQNYKYVLQQELALRRIAPGIMVPNAPDGPAEREEDVSAMKQFLGMKVSEDCTLESI